MTIHTNAIETVWPGVSFRSSQKVLAYWIPISMREKVLAAYADAGIKIRLRYRGPRSQSVGRLMLGVYPHTYRRTRTQANQDCLLEDATHFTVYSRD